MAKNHIHIEPVTKTIKDLLIENGYLITHDAAIDHGWQIRLSQGSIINIYITGRVCLQGKSDTELKELLGLK